MTCSLFGYFDHRFARVWNRGRNVIPGNNEKGCAESCRAFQALCSGTGLIFTTIMPVSKGVTEEQQDSSRNSEVNSRFLGARGKIVENRLETSGD
jgi:hypothetical protein